MKVNQAELLEHFKNKDTSFLIRPVNKKHEKDLMGDRNVDLEILGSVNRGKINISKQKDLLNI